VLPLLEEVAEAPGTAAPVAGQHEAERLAPVEAVELEPDTAADTAVPDTRLNMSDPQWGSSRSGKHMMSK